MQLTRSIAVLIWMAASACHAGEDGIKERMAAASQCSDTALAARVAASCEAPEMLASLALGDCKARWDAVAVKAVGPEPQAQGAALSEYRRLLKIYADALAYEYVRAAELKAIDLRNDAGNCAPDQP